MMDLSEEIISKLKQSNNLLRKQYSNSHSQKDLIRQNLRKSATLIRQMEIISAGYLVNLLEGRKIGGADGSVNQTNGEPPHVLYFFKR